MEKQLKYIPVECLRAHPDNPRKDLGDLTELSDSIRQNGIFQNLTVVPYKHPKTGEAVDGIYTVIIGHRRLAASKLAGLASVPCAIVEMDELQQRRTMLMENMQRAELSPYEQAKGFQLIMDLGGSIAEIVKDTGFSETTVKSRLEWAKLDDEQFKKLEGRQISIADLNSLSKIEDIALRNEALGYLGTVNFKNRFSDIMAKDEWNRDKPIIIEWLKSFAMERDYEDGTANMRYYMTFSQYGGNVLEVPEDAKEKQYVYVVLPSGGISLYYIVKPQDDSEAARLEAERAARDAEYKRQNALAEAINKRLYELRFNFIKDYEPDAADAPVLWSFILKTLMALPGAYSKELDSFAEMVGEESLKDQSFGYRNAPESYEAIEKHLVKAPLKTLLQLMYCITDTEKLGFIGFNWNGKARNYVPIHNESPSLLQIYEMLKAIGYEVSDEEESLMRGEHEIYFKEGEAN